MNHATSPCAVPIRPRLAPARRPGIGLIVVALHVAVIAGLLLVKPVRVAARAAAPLYVSLLAGDVPAPPPPVPLPRVVPRAAPAVRPTVVPTVPQPDVVPPGPDPSITVAVAPAAPPDPPAVTQPVPVAAAAVAAPAVVPVLRTVSIGMVAYRTAPVLIYPPASRRAREEGRVHVRVLVDADGLPCEMEILHSSGFARLDESALATVRATRFRPYSENGVALPFRVVMPLVFELET